MQHTAKRGWGEQLKPSSKLVTRSEEPQWRTLVASTRSQAAWPTLVSGHLCPIVKFQSSNTLSKPVPTNVFPSYYSIPGSGVLSGHRSFFCDIVFGEGVETG